ncbi:MAG: VWA domain-containing protein [Gallicola sp.]|nr:VWA domain-containing protein [Gallicola sp.]
MNHSTELVFILDRSGSMSGLEKDTIGGFNSMLAKQKELEGSCLVTTVLFNHDYKLLHDRIDIRAIQAIREKEYFVGGGTALLDAIGKSIHKISNIQRHTDKKHRASKVLFIIITDGEENSSREYSSAKVKSMIEKMKSKYQWEFVFLAANIDAVKSAASIGISSNRALDYVADSQGTTLNFEVMDTLVETYRDTGYIKEDVLNRVRLDAKKRLKR